MTLTVPIPGAAPLSPVEMITPVEQDVAINPRGTVQTVGAVAPLESIGAVAPLESIGAPAPVESIGAPAAPGRLAGQAHRWVIGCSAVALVPMVEAHVAGAAMVDPFDQPISHYAFVPTGYEMILFGSVLLAGSALAISGAMLGVAARADETTRTRLRVPAALLATFAVAMLLVGLFPTDPPGTVDLSVSATIHRWAAALAFAVLPVIGLLVCRSNAIGARPRAQLWVLSLAVCIGTGLVFAIHLPLAVAGSHIPMFGLIERIGFVVMVAFMVVLSGMLRPGQSRETVPVELAQV